MLTNGLVGSGHKATAGEKPAATLEAARGGFCSLGRSRPGTFRIGRYAKVCFEHHPKCALDLRRTVPKASSTYFGCQKIRMCTNRAHLNHCLGCTCTYFAFHQQTKHVHGDLKLHTLWFPNLHLHACFIPYRSVPDWHVPDFILKVRNVDFAAGREGLHCICGLRAASVHLAM